ncbi:interferon-induced protein with tetratricopeptide repeats 5-like [Pituophis catenifer annectens]|uniref:interferon-induced protein with tetratricopeptide repeats 5-like n=1 Tax=Pituophis catenifer annectens TaxID=94852 RepID=UPI003994C79A
MGHSPAELLMGRKLRCTLDRLHPNYSPDRFRGADQKLRGFQIGTLVFSRNYSEGPLWVAGVISEKKGPKSYTVDVGDGRIWHRHIDQLRKRVAGQPEMYAEIPGPDYQSFPTTAKSSPRRSEDLAGDSGIQRRLSEMPLPAGDSNAPDEIQEVPLAEPGETKGPSDRFDATPQTELCSLLSQEGLKEILQKLECHFTWELQKKHINPDELEERIAEEIRFLINKSKVRNYNLLAYVKFLNNKKDEALENLQKAEEAVPIEYPEDVEKGSLVTWGNYAWVHYHMGNLTESQAYVEKAENTCKQLGSESPYKVELPQIDCDKGWTFLKFGARNYEKAKESFEKALEKEPENPEFNSGYAITVYHLEDHFAKNPSRKESSLEVLKRALKLNPEDVFVLPLLAIKLQESDKKEEGEKWIKEALRKHPGIPYVLRYAAKFYRKKGDVETSLQHLEKALSLTPNSAFLHHQIGLCYRAQYLVMKNESRYDKCQVNDKMDELTRLCIFHFEKAVENKPEFFYANIDLAKRYAEQGELQKADEIYQKLFTMRNLTSLEKQQAHFNYGRFQESDRRLQSEAIKHYFAALKIENDSIERDKCKCILKKLMDKKIRHGEADAENFAILGFIHQLNGDKEQAMKAYEKAFDLDPVNEGYFNKIRKLRLSL